MDELDDIIREFIAMDCPGNCGSCFFDKYLECRKSICGNLAEVKSFLGLEVEPGGDADDIILTGMLWMGRFNEFHALYIEACPVHGCFEDEKCYTCRLGDVMPEKGIRLCEFLDAIYRKLNGVGESEQDTRDDNAN